MNKEGASPIGRKIRAARIASGIKQADLARELGVSREAVSQWEGGKNLPAMSRLQEIARVLGVALTLLIESEPRPDLAVVRPSPPIQRVAPGFPRDVPLMACARSGAAPMVSIGEEIGSAVRLPQIMTARDVFAIYAPSDFLAPWRQAGELIYLDPHRPARRGDHVLVELAEVGQAALGELSEPAAGGATRVGWYMPPGVTKLEPGKIRRVIRAFEWSELIPA
jgi:DNA-binding XRE family transcriptional regulator